MSANNNGRPTTVFTGVSEDKYEFVWKIGNIAMVQKPGFPLDTQKFEVEAGKNQTLKSRWTIGLNRSRGADAVYIYLKRTSASIGGGYQQPVQLTVQLRSSSGSILWTDEVMGNVSSNKELTMNQNRWWTSKKVWGAALDKDGAVTFRITLNLLEPIICGEPLVDLLQEQFQVQSVRFLQRNMELIRKSDLKELVEVKIICSDGMELKCRKAILKGNSDVFKSMLESGLSEARTGVINVPDIPGSAMNVLINYLHTGQLLPSWSEPDVILEFTYAAGKYQLKELIEYLDNMLGRGAGEQYEPNLVIRLHSLVKKLGLEKAEARLKDRVMQLTVSAVSNDETLPLSIFPGNN